MTEQEPKWLKIALTILIIAFVAMMAWATIGRAEEISEPPEIPYGPHLVYTSYDGLYLYGVADVPEGQWWVRCAMFLPGNYFLVIYLPIAGNGEFSAYIATNCYYMVASISDTPYDETYYYSPIGKWPVI